MVEIQNDNQKRILLVMRIIRIVTAAICAFGLLYLIQRSRHNIPAPAVNPTPTQQTAPQTTPEPAQPQR